MNLLKLAPLIYQWIKLNASLFYWGKLIFLKTAQLLPGIQSGNEGASGIYVRGVRTRSKFNFIRRCTYL